VGTEHLDRFLASVERVNAETEHRLSDEYQSRNDIEGEKSDNQKVNLRRGRSLGNRWHSMESLESRGRGRGARGEARVQGEEGRPRSRDSLGPRGFTSMVNLLGPAGQGGQPAAKAGARPKGSVARADSVPPDSLSLATSCSCISDGREEEPIPKQAMNDGKKTKVEYLGSVPIDSKATDLSSLQVPMKNLYLKFIDLKNMGHQHLPGTLEISETGLKVNYIRELHRGVQEIFNPFPTIAVWAAVKFVHKKEHSAAGEIQHRSPPYPATSSYFLPLLLLSSPLTTVHPGLPSFL
jgi:hypothetical protein